jgi:hypothetical protein
LTRRRGKAEEGAEKRKNERKESESRAFGEREECPHEWGHGSLKGYATVRQGGFRRWDAHDDHLWASRYS